MNRLQQCLGEHVRVGLEDVLIFAFYLIANWINAKFPSASSETQTDKDERSFRSGDVSQNLRQTVCFRILSFHALFLIAWLADGDSLMSYIVRMGRQIAKMFSIFSL